jgi:hypothetical protein
MQRMRSVMWVLLATVSLGARATPVGAQGVVPSPAYDPSPRLRAVLPADVADRVLATIGAARSRGLPAQALERTALKGAARQVPPAEIERAVAAQVERLHDAEQALSEAQGRRHSAEEVEAGSEALRRGVEGRTVSELAKSAPPGRSLTVPLHVLGSLVARGLSSGDALAVVMERLKARATDGEIAQLPDQAAARPGGRPAISGPDVAGANRPGGVGGAPAGVPTNGGAGTRPRVPVTPPGGRP